jgi:hypothetical protein
VKAARSDVTIVINFPPSWTLTAPAFKMKNAAFELMLKFTLVSFFELGTSK